MKYIILDTYPVCYYKSWSTKNTFRSIKNIFQSMENTFWSTKNTFQSISVKEKFGLVFRKVFSLYLCLFFRKVVSRKSLSKFSCVCLSLGKLINEKYFPINGKHFLVNFSQRKIWLGFQESVFPLGPVCLLQSSFLLESEFRGT